MKNFSSRTLLAVRRERELVELSIVLYRRLRTATGRECAELFTHPKNRETIADIKGLVSAYAAFKTAYTLASALAVYRLGSHKPRSADTQPEAQPTNRRINRRKSAAPNHCQHHRDLFLSYPA